MTDTVADYNAADYWWEGRRIKYNVALLISGFLAFVCYVLAVDRGISTGRMPGAEITLFTTVFQGIGYLIMMFVANLCYCVGAFVETHFIGHENVNRYRRLAFGVGLWFSVLLPFAIPAMVAWAYLLHPVATTTP